LPWRVEEWLQLADFDMFLANSLRHRRIALDAKGWGQEVVSG
jgi:hypothetical protein